MIEKQDFFTIMGGRVKILQGPYNPTSDAVWLAAFIDGTPKTVLDVGTGTGAVALCLMSRIPNIQMTALDISDKMLTAARDNFNINNQTAEFIQTDLLSWKTNKTFDLVITNPPYFSGTPAKHNAHHNANLDLWVQKCMARVKPNGMFATIIDASLVGKVIFTIIQHHCGDLRIVPLFSTKNFAERVLLSCKLGRIPTAKVYSGLPMNCDAVLRSGATVSMVLDTNGR